ncbi:MAG: putative toxin-antitoxin system toxin component, PIN family [Calditrichaceae bacterium]|nr:putative toxin-antitoxin system toxin component, PIN family [Calditrichaceae bacterium]MBN2709319.1 putative toxin-antitoxin system toxin component, PIN family [Calditrichaceae bacterium]RQV94655.1 MAG: putative toxin-antitoxin system toxin component, PIN family [Calditrichota bacterium]
MKKVNTQLHIPLIVMDTNVLISGLCRYKNSPSYRILKSVQEGITPLALNQKLFLEYESVLCREEIQQLIKATPEEIKMILDALLAIARESEPYYMWRPNLKDEADNFILEAAISTSAILVTKNLKDFVSGELKFPELIIMTPDEFCKHYLEDK